MAPGVIFAGRRVRIYSTFGEYLFEVPAVQRLADCCRRLLCSHGVDVQVSVRMGSWYQWDSDSAAMVRCLAPHLCGLSSACGCGFRLQELLPVAAQLEQLTPIETHLQNLSLLSDFYMLKELHIHLERPVQLTALLPRLHTLHLTCNGTTLRECHLQCLLLQTPALRQLVLSRVVFGLDRWDVEALVGLQCEQLDLLTVETPSIDEHTVNLLARIQCPLKLSIDMVEWSRLQSAPLFTLLARLPNLVALGLTTEWNTLWGAYALWDQRGAILPHVQRLEMMYLRLRMNDSHVPLQSILSTFPALKQLTLHSEQRLKMAEQPEIHARLWHAITCCAELNSLTGV